MAFHEIQKEVDDWAGQFKTPYWHPFEQLARLTEEVGEIARELNHEFGPKKKKVTEEENELGAEIADALFTLVALANSQKINLDEVWRAMMTKLVTRDATRWEKK